MRIDLNLRNHHTPRVVKWLAVVLIIAAIGLLPWIIILGATLKGQTEVRMWSSTWIGLDILEITGLLTTAVLMLKRNIHVMATAAFTAAFFLIDSWFDLMLSQAGSDWYQALFAALFLELPLCLICVGIAVTAPAWCSDTGDGMKTAHTVLKLIPTRRKN